MPPSRSGFSRIEFVVLLACAGAAAGLIPPAILAAREESRETECQEHLRKIGQGVIAHLDAQGHYPTNGWGGRWIGDPDRGFGADQPGGWIFNVLPYVGEEKLHDLGKDATGFKKQAASRTLLSTPLPAFHCPARRPSQLYPHLSTTLFANSSQPEKSAKSDYAINGGDTFVNTGIGPVSAKEEDLKADEWPDGSMFTGVTYVRGRVTADDVTDGKSLTYLCGEKYMPSYSYGGENRYPVPGKPKDRGDDGTMYAGADGDIRRWTFGKPLRDTVDEVNRFAFGGTHKDGFRMTFCDGSVRTISFDIDLALHKSLGNRKDGLPKDDKGL